MNTKQCFSCGTHDGLQHFEPRSITIDFKQMTRQVEDISGWECRVCGEIEFDDGSAERYSDASDQLLMDCRQLLANEMKRIRRKLHLTQKDAVKLLSGGGHNAFSRYERGELAPPQPLFTLMRLLDRHPHLMAEVHALSDGEDLRQLLAKRDTAPAS
ncbi:type II toxin-antitoxin system MqsA family antitoxin [Pseudomonas sp. 10S4]|uniref:type II toxin-antitoxin system MqsA family antitoxin n=1 Tax=Pseudomonas sp. 10S4 TaxID=3048583 RepID=UPI002AC8D279|nr:MULTISPECIES: type II toxin-antitoxin system MqsA family antitoxin [unclassified Pseudomonas]MEB0226359.1 type II toxin-antitoxin system MqsA family antitoxin [Pseudomonas sp. 5S1]MEB0295417.1 type II toxin-antitoxin system MqsA family antitoxin [Pseudomonas sp. 10S4]WPX20876.1 type II toxin-antitoxin system MqsA family antitoxin [Pseudomonas sp. 10S4]